MNKMTELKPCPFCGNKFVKLSDARELEDCMNFEECPECFEQSQSSCNLYIVVCNVNEGGCGASSEYHTTAEKAIEAWNRRWKMDLIDRDAALQAKPEHLNSSVERITETLTLADRSYARGWNACTERWLKEIASLPSAQSEIIYCKNCKHAHLTYNGSCKYCDMWDDAYDSSEKLYLDGDFYCGFAERKQDGS